MNRDPRSLDPLALPLHQYVMLDTETTGLDPRTGGKTAGDRHGAC